MTAFVGPKLEFWHPNGSVLVDKSLEALCRSPMLTYSVKHGGLLSKAQVYSINKAKYEYGFLKMLRGPEAITLGCGTLVLRTGRFAVMV